MSGSANQLFQPDAIPGTGRDNPLAPQPTWADATTKAVTDLTNWIQAQRAQSEQMGLWGPDGITPAGARQAGGMTAGALALATTAPKGDVPGFTAYHGSPHDFDQFDSSKIGTGEGAQAYGHGLYFADAEGVANSYRDDLSDHDVYIDGQKVGQYGAMGNDLRTIAAEKMAIDGPSAARAKIQQSMDEKQAGGYGYDQAEGKALLGHIDDMEQSGAQVEMRPSGHLYEVHVAADPAHFLDWDKPLSEQHPVVQQALAKLPWGEPYAKSSLTGGQIAPKTPEGAQQMADAGIPGIRYLDAGSRGAGEGSRNTVVFDPRILTIMRKYAIPAAMLSGTGHGLVTGSDQQQ